MNPQMMGRMNPAVMNAGMNPGMNPGMSPAMNSGMNSGQMMNQIVGNAPVMPGGPQAPQMGGPNVLPNQNMPPMSQPNIPNQMNAAGLYAHYRLPYSDCLRSHTLLPRKINY